MAEAARQDYSLTEIQGEIFRRDFREYVRDSWHITEGREIIWNWHLDALCDFLTYFYLGEIIRGIVNMPPRFTKSTIVSVAMPTWGWANDGRSQWLTGSYEQGLAERDAVKSRRLMESPWWQDRFGGEWRFNRDENQKKKYVNSLAGHRIAITSAGKTTGEGGDFFTIDDPHNVVDVYSDVKRVSVLDWFDNAANSRLNNQNTSGILLCGQRTHGDDLFGHVMEGGGLVEDGGSWVKVEFPNEYVPLSKCRIVMPDGKLLFTDPRKKEGELLCPPRMNRVATDRMKDLVMSDRDYSAQYQQKPTGEEGLIAKKSWWKKWEWPEWHEQYGTFRYPPKVFKIIQVYDTAFEEDEEADFSARTTWGIFEHRHEVLDVRTGTKVLQEPMMCAILLEAWKDRVEFPELREIVREGAKDWDADSLYIEKKASGHSLIQELRKLPGVPKIQGIKIPGDRSPKARAHVAVLPLEKGSVYYLDRPWVKDVIDECADFPMGKHDDIATTCFHAWMILRRYNEIDMWEDETAKDIALYRRKQKRKESKKKLRKRPMYGGVLPSG